MAGFIGFQRRDGKGDDGENPEQVRRPVREQMREEAFHEEPFREIESHELPSVADEATNRGLGQRW